jgi:ABC-type dipeptide/oligopeptide/nickel transport system permease component
MATSFLFALLTVLGSLIADALYAVADPRIRYD